MKSNNNCKFLIKTLLFIMIIVLMSMTCMSKNITNNYLSDGDPYYKLWDGNFIMYIDNYQGDKNDVSKKDLESGNGTSRVYLFTKLQDDSYTYEVLLADIKNKDKKTNLHDDKAILFILPKTAKSFESHATFKTDDEKGKLFYGGPYDKYASFENGFYYKDKLLTKSEVEELLSTYKSDATSVTNAIKDLKDYSLKELYPEVKSVYMTNGASAIAGTPDAKIYKIDINKKFSPFHVTYGSLREASTKTMSGDDTKNVLPDWDISTLYLFSDDAGKKNDK